MPLASAVERHQDNVKMPFKVGFKKISSLNFILDISRLNLILDIARLNLILDIVRLNLFLFNIL